MRSKWFLSVAACAALAAAGAYGALVDGVVATVDNEPILYSELYEEAAATMGGMPAGATEEQVLREILDQAIERRLLYREAQQAGMEIPDGALEDRLREIKSEYANEEEFRQVLAEAGENIGAFRERLERQMLALAMAMEKNRAFQKEAVITESEMAQYYQDNIQEFRRPERVKLQRIFIGAGQDAAERARARGRLEALREELALGADFGELAKAHSEGPEAASGGQMGWVERGDLVADVDAAAFSVPVGEVSEVIETDFGFLLLKVEDKQEAGLAEYEEVRKEIEPRLRQRYAAERFEKWVKQLRSRGNVQVML